VRKGRKLKSIPKRIKFGKRKNGKSKSGLWKKRKHAGANRSPTPLQNSLTTPKPLRNLSNIAKPLKE